MKEVVASADKLLGSRLVTHQTGPQGKEVKKVYIEQGSDIARTAVLSAGAYCMSMASNYNTRGRAAEVLVDGARAHLIRERETAADQMRLERLL